MELTKKQNIIVKSFDKYLDFIKEKYNVYFDILELTNFEVTEKEYIDIFTFDIKYSWTDDFFDRDISDSFITDIYNFNNFSKLFLPDKAPYFSYNFVRVSKYS